MVHSTTKSPKPAPNASFNWYFAAPEADAHQRGALVMRMRKTSEETPKRCSHQQTRTENRIEKIEKNSQRAGIGEIFSMRNLSSFLHMTV